ncbi:MAG: TlpA disulfide reductase family protein [Flavobacteriales bacterium]|nr:TlpA disulfide reductase family protein [Flavobacteriales bacterium]MDG1396445.1 TlpA disulfide reductase family protein [Flavobacteriales bacterium]
MKNIFFVFTAILAFNFSSVIEAQTIKGKLNIQRQTNKQVDLYRTEGKYKYKIDSTKVLTDGSFTFKYKKHLKGFYKLTLGNENNIVDVILNPSEPIVSLAFSQIRLEKGLEVLESNENKAYWEFKKEDSAVQSKIKNLKKQRGQFKSQANEVKVNEMTNQIIKLEKELFNFVQTVINKYPTTFFSKTKIASLSKTPKDKATYFDDLDFSNESLIRSDVYATRFQDYIIKHSGHTEVGYYNAVDDIMKKSKVNEKVFEFALYNLLDGFYGSGLEDVATYIMEEYFYGEACGEIEINDLLRSKADLIKNLQIGNTPPDFTIKSNYGADVNLKNTCANNKYTIIMFWATHCPHCMRDLPGFVPVYNEYKSKGLEVIGVALDVNKTKWKNTIEEKGFNWKNVSQFGNYKSPVCIDYKINKTPSWFILDSSMKIIAKPKGKQEILRFLKNNL